MPEAHDKKRYNDTYKGTVSLNIDPELRGRCYVLVPEISPVPLTSPADINFPFGGNASGMFSPAPMVGSCVWVQFRGGDLDKPLIVGARYENPLEIPALAHAVPPGVDCKVMTTQLQHQFAMSDVPGPTGGFMLLTPTGAGIIINTLGVFIIGGPGIGSIAITPAGVDINGVGPAAGLSVR
jgi:hypothetical protein